MNDKEYIKAGVELADGWEWNHGGAFCDAIGRDLLFGRDRVELKRWMLAALKEQLVEQLDDIEPLRLVERRGFTAIRHLVMHGASVNSWKEEDYVIAHGQDRLMNSIKAIVDSRALI